MTRPESERPEYLHSAETETEPESLPELLQAERARADAAEDQLLRHRAETQNSNERIRREHATRLKFANEGLLRKMLSVFDNLETCLSGSAQSSDTSTLREGLELTLAEFYETMENLGVEAFNAAPGERFNPALHEALTIQPSANVPTQHVLEAVQKGFRYHERILRPARVVVSSGSA